MNYAPATPKVMRNMVPNSYARSFMAGAGDGPYTLRFDAEDWCRVYKGRRSVWHCNGTFARAHFRQAATTKGA